MPGTQSAGTPNAAHNNGGDPSQLNKRTPKDEGREAQQQSQGAEAAFQAGAEATQEVARANQEVLRANIGIAQDALHAPTETASQVVETLTNTLSGTFVAAQDRQAAEESAENIRAVSQASTALARGAQEASRAWFELIQQTTRTNLEGLTRTMQEVMSVQRGLARENVQRAIDSGDALARSTSGAVQEANRAMQPAARGGGVGH